MPNLPEQGYTPANYAKLVELTELSNVAFCEQFSIPKGTFEKHKAGSRTMKWQDWQALLNNVNNFISENIMSEISEYLCTNGANSSLKVSASSADEALSIAAKRFDNEFDYVLPINVESECGSVGACINAKTVRMPVTDDELGLNDNYN